MNNAIDTYIPYDCNINVKSNINENGQKIENITIEIYLKQDAFENMSVSVACRLGLADTFCCLLVLFKIS